MLHVGHSNVIIVVLYGRWCTNTGKVNLIKITSLTYSPLLIIVMAWGIRRNVIYRTYMSEDQALHGHKTFEHEFVLILKKTANQITVSIKYSILIGWFWSTSENWTRKCYDPNVICSCILVLLVCSWSNISICTKYFT